MKQYIIRNQCNSAKGEQYVKFAEGAIAVFNTKKALQSTLLQPNLLKAGFDCNKTANRSDLIGCFIWGRLRQMLLTFYAWFY
jgi:hypothetical protein